jgi:hypothetical protein
MWSISYLLYCGSMECEINEWMNVSNLYLYLYHTHQYGNFKSNIRMFRCNHQKVSPCTLLRTNADSDIEKQIHTYSNACYMLSKHWCNIIPVRLCADFHSSHQLISWILAIAITFTLDSITFCIACLKTSAHNLYINFIIWWQAKQATLLRTSYYECPIKLIHLFYLFVVCLLIFSLFEAI